ncbi:MAG TPA: ABC transporter substrate-binding protein [Firmicutes bacterium]|nr:ABC transporter substrate-binding protein [Bacillota bacterium]
MRGSRVLVVTVLLCCLVVAGCGAGTPKSEQPAPAPETEKGLAPPSPPVKVTVGMKQVVSDAGVLIGMARGYYTELGIQIEPVQFNSGQEMINALAAGQLDVGCTVTAAGLFNAMLRGIPIKIVADKGYNVPGQGYYRLCIRKDLAGEIKDFEDLKGRKLAVVATASLDEIALDRCLNAGGFSTKDGNVEVIRAFPDMLVAMANKSIDGAMVIEPFVTQGMAKGILDPWKDPSEYDPHAQTALLVYGPSITGRPQVADRFMVAYIKSLRDYNDAFFKDKGKADIVTVLAEWSVVKDKALYDKMFPVGLNPNGYVREKGIELDLAWYKDRGLLKGDLSVRDVVDNQYVDRALKVLGEYQR